MKLLPLFCALLPSMAAWLTVSCDKDADPAPSPEVVSPDSLVRLARTWNEWTFEMEYSKAPAPFSKKNLRRIVPLLPRDLQLHRPDYRAGDTLLNFPIEVLGDTLQPQRAADLKFNATFERLYHRTIGVAPHVCGVRKIIVQALHASQPPVDLTEQARVIIPSYAYGGKCRSCVSTDKWQTTTIPSRACKTHCTSGAWKPEEARTWGIFPRALRSSSRCER